MLDIICGLTLAGSAVGFARTLGLRQTSVTRFAWIGLATDFGFWTLIILSNQSHGRPPKSDLWVLGMCVLCTGLSSAGLAMDPIWSAKKADSA